MARMMYVDYSVDFDGKPGIETTAGITLYPVMGHDPLRQFDGYTYDPPHVQAAQIILSHRGKDNGPVNDRQRRV